MRSGLQSTGAWVRAWPGGSCSWLMVASCFVGSVNEWVPEGGWMKVVEVLRVKKRKEREEKEKEKRWKEKLKVEVESLF